MKPSSASQVICAACGHPNRPTAMFCIGCAGRLPGFVATGPSALETARVLRPRHGAPMQSHAPSPVLPSETGSFWLRLGLLVLAMVIAFVGWYVYVTRRATGPELPVAAEAPAPSSFPSTSPSPPSANAPIAPPAAPSPPAAATEGTGRPRRDASVQAAAEFYRALSEADGAAAAALVIPEKRGRGPFQEDRISSFYGSFRERLAVRSIRAVDDHNVVVKYRYRATRTKCEGTALVETVSIRQQTLIRSIRANC